MEAIGTYLPLGFCHTSIDMECHPSNVDRSSQSDAKKFTHHIAPLPLNGARPNRWTCSMRWNDLVFVAVVVDDACCRLFCCFVPALRVFLHIFISLCHQHTHNFYSFSLPINDNDETFEIFLVYFAPFSQHPFFHSASLASLAFFPIDTGISLFVRAACFR